MINYVTYNETGALTGAYYQNVHPSHAASYIEVSAEEKQHWVQYQANPERNGIELVPVVVSAPAIADYINAVQKHLDDAAQARGYDNIVSVCSYAGAPNPFQTEAAAFVGWRGDVWVSCQQTMAAVESGAIVAPSIAELITSLPELIL